MKRFRTLFDYYSLVVALACLLVLLLAAWWLPPAHADSKLRPECGPNPTIADPCPPLPDHGPKWECMTVWEANQIEWFRPFTEAREIVDGPGVRREHGRMRDYKWCGKPWSRARIVVMLWPNGVVRSVFMIEVDEGILLRRPLP